MEETKYTKFANVLRQVVDNGRLVLGTIEELENEIAFEAQEQGVDMEEAVEYAKEHYEF